MWSSWWITSLKEAVTSRESGASSLSPCEISFLCLACGPSNTSCNHCPVSAMVSMVCICFGGGVICYSRPQSQMLQTVGQAASCGSAGPDILSPFRSKALGWSLRASNIHSKCLCEGALSLRSMESRRGDPPAKSSTTTQPGRGPREWPGCCGAPSSQWDRQKWHLSLGFNTLAHYFQ